MSNTKIACLCLDPSHDGTSCDKCKREHERLVDLEKIEAEMQEEERTGTVVTDPWSVFKNPKNV